MPNPAIFNVCEAFLWFLIAAGFFLTAIVRAKTGRQDTFLAGVLFLFFGLSDLVEITTGAWWRPWWLPAWKALCVLGLLALYVRYRREKKEAKKSQPASTHTGLE